MCSNGNYRGISLSNSICKLFDYVFIHTHKGSLQICDLQFGFKSNHSTLLCTVIYMETINHYVMFIVVYLMQVKHLTQSTLGKTIQDFN